MKNIYTVQMCPPIDRYDVDNINSIENWMHPEILNITSSQKTNEGKPDHIWLEERVLRTHLKFYIEAISSEIAVVCCTKYLELLISMSKMQGYKTIVQDVVDELNAILEHSYDKLSVKEENDNEKNKNEIYKKTDEICLKVVSEIRKLSLDPPDIYVSKNDDYRLNWVFNDICIFDLFITNKGIFGNFRISDTDEGSNMRFLSIDDAVQFVYTLSHGLYG